MKKLTTEKFIENAKKIHGDKYDYSLVEYKSKCKKVKIICNEHGIFEQTAFSHLSGHNCNYCSIEKRKSNTADFIKKANVIHKNKYDYSIVEYVGCNSKIKIICKEHGIF